MQVKRGKNKMVTRKQIWDAMDLLEGKKKGTSYKKLEKEMKLFLMQQDFLRQGYKKKARKK